MEFFLEATAWREDKDERQYCMIVDYQQGLTQIAVGNSVIMCLLMSVTWWLTYSIAHPCKDLRISCEDAGAVGGCRSPSRGLNGSKNQVALYLNIFK